MSKLIDAETGRVVGEIVPNPPAYRGFRCGPWSKSKARAIFTMFFLREDEARHELMAYDLERVPNADIEGNTTAQCDNSADVPIDQEDPKC